MVNWHYVFNDKFIPIPSDSLPPEDKVPVDADPNEAVAHDHALLLQPLISSLTLLPTLPACCLVILYDQLLYLPKLVLVLGQDGEHAPLTVKDDGVDG